MTPRERFDKADEARKAMILDLRAGERVPMDRYQKVRDEWTSAAMALDPVEFQREFGRTAP